LLNSPLFHYSNNRFHAKLIDFNNINLKCTEDLLMITGRKNVNKISNLINGIN